MDEKLTKEDWEKILKDANTFLRETWIEATINMSVIKTAKEAIKIFDEDEDGNCERHFINGIDGRKCIHCGLKSEKILTKKP